MSTKTVRLLSVVGTVVLLGALTSNLMRETPARDLLVPTTPSIAPLTSTPSPTAVSDPFATPTLRPEPAPSSVEYAIALAELDGMSPDIVPGTPIDVWVTWDPPITRAPKVQRLLREVEVARVVPPVTPEGPEVVILRVGADRVPRLIYGDRYGALTVTAPSP